MALRASLRQCLRGVGAPPMRGLASFYDKRVEKWSELTPPVVSVADLFVPTTAVSDAALMSSASLLNTNIAVRLAKRIQVMNSMPFIFGINPNVHRMYHLYYRAFVLLSECRAPTTVSEVMHLSQGLYTELLTETAAIVPTLARASKELNSKVLEGMMDKNELTSFFNTMLSGRLLRRLLMHHHLMLTKQYLEPDAIPNHRGVISNHCDVYECAQRAFEAVRRICLQKYGCAPTLLIERGPDRPMRYVESHIIFMLIEVFKNSARATIEHQGRVSENLSPVQLSVFQTEPGVVQIKVKDEGGGIPLDLTDSIFDYGFSTFVPSTNDDTLDTLVDSGLPIGVTARPIDGEGFGLPMTRQYARFFGGDLQILVTQGFGTEVHIRLQEPRAISLESID